MATPIIEIVQGDILKFQADAVLLKFADRLHGVDRLVFGLLQGVGALKRPFFVEPGKHVVVRGAGATAQRHVVFVGVGPLYEFRYEAIRQMADRSLEVVAVELPNAVHVVTPLHGPQMGLDEVEAARAQIAGYNDAIRAGRPTSLQRITIVEIDEARARRVVQATVGDARDAATAKRGPVSLERAAASRVTQLAGGASEAKARAFVAMPFTTAMEDVFQFGIYGPVTRLGFLCERADLTPFLGEVVPQLRRCIETAMFVVGVLTGVNPNVFLEIGYAWAKERPTVLVAERHEKPPFDVQGYRCLLYDNIASLAKMLHDEMTGLQQAGVLPTPA
jgi:hypothetical protein